MTVMIPTVLVVEDNTLNSELVRDGLITAGMKVVEARTAHEGLQAATELNPISSCSTFGCLDSMDSPYSSASSPIPQPLQFLW
jgi:CheY-like chemotaxis protein